MFSNYSKSDFCYSLRHPELDSGSIPNGALQLTLIDSESSSEWRFEVGSLKFQYTPKVTFVTH